MAWLDKSSCGKIIKCGLQTFAFSPCFILKNNLYFETGFKPVSFVISSQRLNYFKKIHSREDHELIKSVYEAQKQNPSKGD